MDATNPAPDFPRPASFPLSLILKKCADAKQLESTCKAHGKLISLTRQFDTLCVSRGPMPAIPSLWGMVPIFSQREKKKKKKNWFNH